MRRAPGFAMGSALLLVLAACTDAPETITSASPPSAAPSAFAGPSAPSPFPTPDINLTPSPSYTEVHIRNDTVQVPLDVPRTDAVRFEVNNYDPSLAFSVRSPSGEEFRPDPQGGIVYNQQVVFVRSPEPGVWTVTMEPSVNPQLVRVAAIPVNIPENPVAILHVTQTGPRTFRYDSSGSYDPDGSVVGFLWGFADGTYSSDASGSHTYERPGTYLISLQVVDNEGNRGFDFSDTFDVP